ncbi:MAG: hypothetical protein HQ495_04405 [Alphaproteobacteria bacterium]|nr:hypothetical protein [Alphaproteobacteria bacterium]
MTYFNQSELECPSTKQVALAPGFADALDGLRRAFRRPMRVNSCCRSVAHNKTVGGHPRSLHLIANPYWTYPKGDARAGMPLDTCAIDIAVPDGSYRGALLAVAWSHGFSIGVSRTFVHLDARTLVLGLSQTTFLYD